MAEEAKVAVRSIRREGMDMAKASQKDGEMTEDELKQAENDIQKITDKNIEEIDKILEIKEKEVKNMCSILEDIENHLNHIKQILQLDKE